LIHSLTMKPEDCVILQFLLALVDSITLNSNKPASSTASLKEQKSEMYLVKTPITLHDTGFNINMDEYQDHEYYVHNDSIYVTTHGYPENALSLYDMYGKKDLESDGASEACEFVDDILLDELMYDNGEDVHVSNSNLGDLLDNRHDEDGSKRGLQTQQQEATEESTQQQFCYGATMFARYNSSSSCTSTTDTTAATYTSQSSQRAKSSIVCKTTFSGSAFTRQRIPVNYSYDCSDFSSLDRSQSMTAASDANQSSGTVKKCKKTLSLPCLCATKPEESGSTDNWLIW